ncbi:MAG: hypothetical protein AAF467_21365 [Actinomycetota bacterium]
MSDQYLTAVSEADAVEELHQLGCTDGLPVIVPTPERVDRAVLATGLGAALSLGALGPNLGDATVEKVATAAVMAGCLPDYLPAVVAAVQAVADPAFDLTEMQATTHSTAPFIIVNGPARSAMGVASGYGALGPGFRANASIGRALRLAMINIGGARPGEADMALLGHPGKFTYCLGELEEASPWEPLHASRGFTPDSSAVTVVGAEGPHSVIAVADRADDPGGERILDAVAEGFASRITNNAILRGGAGVVIINPDHAAVLGEAGLSRADVQQAIVDRAVNTRGDLAARAPAFGGGGDPDDLVPAFFDPADVLVLVAGGPGLYSVIMPTWCAGPNRNRAVSMAIELDQACAVPFAVDAAQPTAVGSGT